MRYATSGRGDAVNVVGGPSVGDPSGKSELFFNDVYLVANKCENERL